LNGFAKGYALRAVAHILQENSVHNALISMGNSSVLATGKHPNGTGWSVGMYPTLAKKDTAITLFNECLTNIR
jgi:thiamine biosynthesis lipoprotein ApbE